MRKLREIIIGVLATLFSFMALSALGQKADSTKPQKIYYFQFNEEYTNAILKILQSSDESHKIVTLVLNTFIYEIQHQPTIVVDSPKATLPTVPSSTPKSKKK